MYFKEDELIITEGNSKGTDKVGQVITANNFEYDKIKNILKANGNVKIEDTIKNYEILTDNAVYFKEDELIITEGNSKGTDKVGQVITANNFEYDKIKNILKANGNVKIEDTIKNYEIFSEKN